MAFSPLGTGLRGTPSPHCPQAFVFCFLYIETVYSNIYSRCLFWVVSDKILFMVPNIKHNTFHICKNWAHDRACSSNRFVYSFSFSEFQFFGWFSVQGLFINEVIVLENVNCTTYLIRLIMIKYCHIQYHLDGNLNLTIIRVSQLSSLCLA